MASYIHPISFRVGQIIIDSEGNLASIEEVEFVPASAVAIDGKVEAVDGYYDVTLVNSSGEEQLWEYKADEYVCALLGENARYEGKQ
jgi:hypothetical protein